MKNTKQTTWNSKGERVSVEIPESFTIVYPQGPKGAQGNRPARRVERDGRVSYVPQ